MPAFLFLLGTTPELSRPELRAVVPGEVTSLTDSIEQVELASREVAQDVLLKLGGTIKVAEVLKHIPSRDEKVLIDAIVAVLKSQSKPNFAIWNTHRAGVAHISAPTIKKELQELGVPSRYQEVEAHGVPAAVLSHRKVTELWLVGQGEATILAESVGVQDIDTWTLRDRSKPFAQRKKGMLPPKVARMMVNIGLGELSHDLSAQPVLYDPFCGSGTILMEAAMRDCQIWGSDTSSDSVSGTIANIAWLETMTQLDFTSSIFQADVTKATRTGLDKNIHLIVTEPFLGKPKPLAQQVPNMIKGLEKLYLGAFKHWTQLLQPGGVVAMVFPRIEMEGKLYTWQVFIDKLAQLGYTTTLGPVVYGRPQAITQRELFVLKYKA